MRTTIGAARRRKKNRLFKQVKGYRGGRGKLLRTAKETAVPRVPTLSATARSVLASFASCGSSALTPRARAWSALQRVHEWPEEVGH